MINPLTVSGVVHWVPAKQTKASKLEHESLLNLNFILFIFRCSPLKFKVYAFTRLNYVAVKLFTNMMNTITRNHALYRRVISLRDVIYINI